MGLAIIGLGKMGLNIAKRISKSGLHVSGFDVSPKSVDLLPKKNFYLANSLCDAVNSLQVPRVIWLMLPSGYETELTIEQLSNIISLNDIVIDGGNSNYKDTQRRGKFLIDQGYQFIDVGVSGGIWGLDNGYCLMVGGESRSVNILEDIFNILSTNQSEGWAHLGPLGAGHYAKMIHNGIEYGMMQAYAEGLELAYSNKQIPLDIEKITGLWKHGSIIRSWLLDILHEGIKSSPNIDQILPSVPDSGEGRWFAIEAIEQGIPTPVITQALNVRLQSQNKFDFGLKILSVMRNIFGGHEINKK